MIDFSSPQWFDQYLAYRKKHPVILHTVDAGHWGAKNGQLDRFESRQHPLYEMLRNSGLIYGFPVEYPFLPKPPLKLSRRRWVQLTLLDMILYSILEEKSREDQSNEEKVALAGNHIRAYYNGIHARTGLRGQNTIEKILSSRVSFSRSFFDFRRSGINSYLFWDWYFFMEYLRSNGEVNAGGPAFFENLLQRKKAMKLLTMELIGAAVWSDHRIRRGEKVLQHHFKRSAQYLSENEKARIKKKIRDGVLLDHLIIPDLSWTARRYLLDISLLAVFADKSIEKEEEQWLQELTRKLHLQEEDLLESKITLGGFLFRHGRRLHFYNDRKSSLALIGQAVMENSGKLQRATRMEYQETVDMATTFGLLLRHQLRLGEEPRLPSEDEIAFALEQLKDLPKFLPFFSMAFIPVPGLTEMYILLAYSVEKFTGNAIRLLPSQFSRMVKGK